MTDVFRRPTMLYRQKIIVLNFIIFNAKLKQYIVTERVKVIINDDNF